MLQSISGRASGEIQACFVHIMLCSGYVEGSPSSNAPISKMGQFVNLYGGCGMVDGLVILKGVEVMGNEIETLINELKCMNLIGKEVDDDPVEETKMWRGFDASLRAYLLSHKLHHEWFQVEVTKEEGGVDTFFPWPARRVESLMIERFPMVLFGKKSSSPTTSSNRLLCKMMDLPPSVTGQTAHASLHWLRCKLSMSSLNRVLCTPLNLQKKGGGSWSPSKR